MGRGFAITTSTPSLRLDEQGQAEVTFTVTNALGRPVRGRAALEPEGAMRKEWLTLVGEPERNFASDGTHQYTIRLAVPPGAPEGSYAFHLSEVSVENPDEDFTTGPSVGFQVARPALPVSKKKFPVWTVALAAGVLLIILAGVLIDRHHRHAGTGGSGAADQHVFLHFNGTSSYVDLGNPSALNFSGTLTVEAWIRPQALDGLRDIVAHGYTFSPPGELYLRIFNGTYQVGTWNGQDFSGSVAAPASDIGQWVHLAGVYDGAQWLLFRNGEQVGANPSPVGVLHVEAPWAIGARGGGSERFFQGDIRDVMGLFVAGAPQGFAHLHPPGSVGALRWAGFDPDVAALGPIGVASEWH
ncbi:MAG: LamG domain-containing protein, partial [Archangium sp.]